MDDDGIGSKALLSLAKKKAKNGEYEWGIASKEWGIRAISTALKVQSANKQRCSSDFIIIIQNRFLNRIFYESNLC